MHFIAVDSFRLFRGAITEILLDKSFTTETPESKTSLARKSIALLSSESTKHKQFAEWIYVKLSCIIDEVHSGQNVNENCLRQKFNSFQSSVEFCGKWKSFLTEVDLRPYPMACDTGTI